MYLFISSRLLLDATLNAASWLVTFYYDRKEVLQAALSVRHPWCVDYQLTCSIDYGVKPSLTSHFHIQQSALDIHLILFQNQ